MLPVAKYFIIWQTNMLGIYYIDGINYIILIPARIYSMNIYVTNMKTKMFSPYLKKFVGHTKNHFNGIGSHPNFFSKILTLCINSDSLREVVTLSWWHQTCYSDHLEILKRVLCDVRVWWMYILHYINFVFTRGSKQIWFSIIKYSSYRDVLGHKLHTSSTRLLMVDNE